MLGDHDDPLGVLANMGIDHPSRWQLLYTVGTMVAFVNAIVGGSAVALAAAVSGANLPLAVMIGALAAILSVVVHLRWQRQTHDVGREQREVLFPSSWT